MSTPPLTPLTKPDDKPSRAPLISHGQLGRHILIVLLTFLGVNLAVFIGISFIVFVVLMTVDNSVPDEAFLTSVLCGAPPALIAGSLVAMRKLLPVIQRGYRNDR